MSPLFLYIEISSDSLGISYEKPIISTIKKNFAEVLTFDFDNFSDGLVLRYANELLKESEQTIVFFEVEETSNLKQLMPLLTKILDKPEQLTIIMRGNNERLEKILSILNYLKIQENTHEIELIETIRSRFLSNTDKH
jgi:hypothetical protein